MSSKHLSKSGMWLKLRRTCDFIYKTTNVLEAG
jgi:hypothetical protein